MIVVLIIPLSWVVVMRYVLKEKKSEEGETILTVLYLVYNSFILSSKWTIWFGFSWNQNNCDAVLALQKLNRSYLQKV